MFPFLIRKFGVHSTALFALGIQVLIIGMGLFVFHLYWHEDYLSNLFLSLLYQESHQIFFYIFLALAALSRMFFYIFDLSLVDIVQANVETKSMRLIADHVEANAVSFMLMLSPILSISSFID